MNKEVRLEVLNLSKSIFSDREFNAIAYYLQEERYNRLRLFIAEQMELLEAVFVLDPDDEVIATQIRMCNKLEDLVINEYLGVLKE